MLQLLDLLDALLHFGGLSVWIGRKLGFETPSSQFAAGAVTAITMLFSLAAVLYLILSVVK
jgi:hypothetical protein